MRTQLKSKKQISIDFYFSKRNKKIEYSDNMQRIIKSISDNKF